MEQQWLSCLVAHGQHGSG